MKLLTPQKAYELAKTRNFLILRQEQISPHFTWGEVFKNCTDQEIYDCPRAYYDNALKQAALMERIRDVFGVPVIVHVWYRSPAHNRRVGGADKSQHLLALATDWHLLGFESPEANKNVQKRLDKQAFMKKCGLEFTKGDWTHTDSRSEADGKKYGYRF